jgi:predicted dehydrogenase
MDRADLVAVLSRDPARARDMAQHFPGCEGYDDLDDLVRGSKPDAAFLCTIPAAHGDIEHALIRHRVPFFVEKPPGIDTETSERIAEAVEKAGLATSVGFHMRYRKSVRRGFELLQDRKILAASGFWMAGLPASSWWNDRRLSGGQMIEQTIHIFDLIRHLCGEVSGVRAAFSRERAGESPAGTAHEAREGIAEAADTGRADRPLQSHETDAQSQQDPRVPVAGGVLCTLESGAVATVMNSCAMAHGHRIGLEIFTRSGTLTLEGHRGVFDGRGGRIEVKDTDDPFELEDAAFLRAVQSGDRSGILSPYTDALETQRLAVAASRSAES